MSVQVTNITLDDRVLKQILRNLPDHINDWLDGEAQEIVNDIKLSFGTSPSAPGDPPGVDTGALRASIRWERGGEYERIVYDGVEYGVDLEFGLSNMAARPFITPIMEQHRLTIGRSAQRAGLING